MKKKYIFFGISILVFLMILTGCGTFISVRFDVQREWIENKDYTIQFTVSPLDTVTSVDLYFRINTNPFTKVQAVQQGVHFSHVIPKQDVIPGKIEFYTIVYDAEGKEHKSSVTAVRVYSRAEATARAERDLIARVKHVPMDQAPVTMDLELKFSISSSVAVVRFFYSPSRGAEYITVVPDRRGQDYYVTIPSSGLREGILSYFLKIEEPNDEFGTIGVYFPESGDIRPYSVKIIGLDEIVQAIDAEIIAAVTHKALLEVPETRDLPLSLSIDMSKTPLLNKLKNGPLSAILYSGIRGRYSAAWESSVMNEINNGIFQGVISKRDIQNGVNQYYFEVSVDIDSIGRLNVDIPAGGKRNPYYYTIITLAELKARLAEALFAKLSHEPVKESDGFAPLELTLNMEKVDVPVRGILHTKTQNGRSKKEILMTQTSKGLTGLISAADQNADFTNYYFEITALYDEEGEVTVIYPKSGESRPFGYSLISKEVAYERLVDSLLKRVSHAPVTQVAEGEDAKIEVKVVNPVRGTEVYVFYKKPSNRTFTEVKATGSGTSFLYTLDKKAIAEGVDSYYIEVIEPHAYLGTIIARFPENGASRPFRFSVTSIETQISGLFSFSPVKEVESAKDIKIQIKTNKSVSGMQLALRYRISGESKAYQTIPMKQAGINYSADIPFISDMSGKTIEYYFLLQFPGIGKDYTYPESINNPFSVYVKEDKENGKDKDKK